MASLVTLVMSDIVGSTRRWAADEASMAADLELHDQILSAAVQEASGTLVKHTGDGMLAVFDDPMSGAEAAAAVQRTIGAASWRHTEALRVRVAVHTGMVFHRDGDVFGTPVNRVARLLDLCPPGAVLVSGVVANLLAERAPQGLGVRAVGEVALAGFSTPEPVHALSGPGLAEVQALEPGATVRRRGGALPPLHDELVGRTELLGAVWQALGRSRLVTLVGVGGMGKTRLALEVAAGAAESLADGAWWIDLSVATSAQAVVPVALAAVGAREVPGRTALQALVDRLAGLTALVVVDNCEHVLQEATQLVEALRADAPGLTLLTTSREALGLRGEKVLPLGSLTTPDGVRLFVERAQAVRPDLDAQAQQAAVQAICERLDGIPLAIELAAARCRSMSPAEIAQRLDDRFKLLRGGRAGAERHRTLQAAVAWSHALLQPEERAVFEQMAVFAGGALIDALAAVCELDEFDALDIVDRLIARSLVVAVATPLGTRYQQLETLRQFAEDRLLQDGALDGVRQRHMVWALALVHQLQAARGMEAEAQAYRRFAAELENLRVAVAHARSNGQHHVSHQIVARLTSVVYGLPAWEVRHWAQPIRLEDGWTNDAAHCEVGYAFLEAHSGRPVSPLRVVTDLPPWYPVANNRTRLRYLRLQSLVGGDVNILLEQLARCDPVEDIERLEMSMTRLSMDIYRTWQDPGSLTPRPDAACEATVALARQLDGVATLCSVLTYGAIYKIKCSRPNQGAEMAREAVRLAEALGAKYLMDLAQAVLTWALIEMEPSMELLETIRNQTRKALERKQLPAAALRMRSVANIVAREYPAAVVPLADFYRHRFGHSFNAFNAKPPLHALVDEGGIDLSAVLTREAGLLPNQPSTVETEFAACIEEALEALERVIAKAHKSGGRLPETPEQPCS